MASPLRGSAPYTEKEELDANPSDESKGSKGSDDAETKPGFKVVAKLEHKTSLVECLDRRSNSSSSGGDGGKTNNTDDEKNTPNETVSVKKEDNEEPPREVTITKRLLKSPLEGFVLSNVLSKTECESLLKGVTKSGRNYTFWNPEALDKRDTRNVDTVEVFDESLAAALWSRVREHVLKEVEIPEENDDWEYGLEGKWVACGMNPRMLFARYSPRGHFSPHTDGHVVIDFNHRSLHSVIIYLNTCEEGGSTQLFKPMDHKRKKFIQDAKGRFRLPQDMVADKALPRVGSLLSFSQHLMHEGEPVGDGCTKFIIRTDVMYKRTPAVCTSPKDLEAYDCFIKAGEAEANKEYEKAANLYSRISRLSEKFAKMVHVYDMC